MPDPRSYMIEERLRSAKRILVVSSGKGGVGKSLVASLVASVLAREGKRVGLLDLDFTSPSTHVVLGAGDARLTEDRGIVPAHVQGLEYVSIVSYSHDDPLPLRGADISNALIELLAVTRWPDVDYLIIDMPPGTGDAMLDLVRLLKRVEFIIVTTPSPLAFETVKKVVTLLSEMKVPIAGMIENMKVKGSRFIEEQAVILRVPYWGALPYDTQIEDSLGSVSKLLRTSFGKELREMVLLRLR